MELKRKDDFLLILGFCETLHILLLVSRHSRIRLRSVTCFAVLTFFILSLSCQKVN